MKWCVPFFMGAAGAGSEKLKRVLCATDGRTVRGPYCAAYTKLYSKDGPPTKTHPWAPVCMASFNTTRNPKIKEHKNQRTNTTNQKIKFKTSHQIKF